MSSESEAGPSGTASYVGEQAHSDDENAEMIKAITASIMEKQADTVTRMAKDAIAAMMATKGKNLAEEVEDRIRGKEKSKKKPYLQKPANKKQYAHQEEMLETVEEVERALKRKQIDKAEEALARGKSIIKRQMKLIRLADREGWATVHEVMI